LSAHSQDTARTAIIAARCSFRPGAAGARDPLKIEATLGDELPKSECRPVAQLTLRHASRSIGFRCVETDKPKSLAHNANCVAIQYLNLTRIERRSICHRCAEGESEDETADHWPQLRTQAYLGTPLKPLFEPKK
jgi:hypothetical protein